MSRIQILINGEKHILTEACSVESLLEKLGYTRDFVAVALNRMCVRRAAYATSIIQNSDEIEILAPMAGG
jgi:thiamine biosynthesis protein ThiS